MPRNSPDEGLIHAWLDGELSPDEAARVERLVRVDPEWAAAASEARGLTAASSRILGALDAVPGDVLPAGSRAAPADRKTTRSVSATRSLFSVRPWMRVAAGLVLVVGTAVIVNDRVGMDAAFEPAVAAGSSAEQVQPSASTDADRRVTSDSVRQDERREVAVSASSTPVPSADVAAASRKATAPSRASVPENVPESVPASVPAPAPAQPSDSLQNALRITPPTTIQQADDMMRLRSERGFGTVSAEARPMAAGLSSSAAVLEGCWRTLTRASVDSILVSPRIMKTEGRMLTILASTRTATVVQIADTLAGTIVDRDGARIPFRAERVGCP